MTVQLSSQAIALSSACRPTAVSGLAPIVLRAQNDPGKKRVRMWLLDFDDNQLQSGLNVRSRPHVSEPAPLQVWQTITLGIYKGVDDYRDAMDSAGIKMRDSAGEILSQPAFSYARLKTEVELALVSAFELGVEVETSLSDVYKRAKQIGLELCPAEVGPQLRLHYRNQPLGEPLNIAMEPIAASSGDPRILALVNFGSGLALMGVNGRCEFMVHRTSLFVFALPTKRPSTRDRMSSHFHTEFADALREVEVQDAATSTVRNMMVACRKLLEHQKAQRAYPVANLFGNWIVQTELTSGKRETGFEILDAINREIVAMIAREGSSGPFGELMTGRFRFDVLRTELLALCTAFSVAAGPIADENLWPKVRRQLLLAICEAPIRADARTTAQFIVQHPKANRVATAVSITRKPGGVWQGLSEFHFITELSQVAELSLLAAPLRLISQIVFDGSA